MKKLLTIAILITISLTPLFAFTGEVIEVSGKVEIETDTGWKTLQKGDIVEIGKVISTGFRSSAKIQVAGSEVVVNQLSRLTLEQLTETSDAHESEVFLDLGSISADVKKAKNKRVGFVVNTPVATASVRGTSFEMSVDKLRVTSGLIAYGGKKSTVAVPVAKGTSTVITETGSVVQPAQNKIAELLGTVATEEPMESIATTMTSSATQVEEKAPETASIGIVVK